MIELQCINKVITEKSFDIFVRHGIDEEYFNAYLPEFEFIYDHYLEFGNIPDKETIIQEFDDFEFLTVNESWEFLLDKLKEERTYKEMCKTVAKLQELTDDSNEAVKYLAAEVERLTGLHKAADVGLDIIRNARERLAEFEKTNEGENQGIPLGLTALQESIGGWNSQGELILIVGRLNEGKTWLMLFFLVIAWQNGRKVLFYSGEMPKNVIAQRFDTLNAHFSNRALRVGEEKVKEDYSKYIGDLENCDKESFIIITPKDLKGKMNVKKLKWLIDVVQPDIIGLDQLSILEDCRGGRGDGNVQRLMNISEDLYALSEETGIPIISPAQAKRVDKKAKNYDEEATPEADDIYGGDGPGQNATRILGMKQVDSGIKIAVRKNRYGEKGAEFLYAWEIDNGRIIDKPISEPSRTLEKDYSEGNSDDVTDVF